MIAVHVTEADIAAGVPCSPTFGAVALAVKRATGLPAFVRPGAAGVFGSRRLDWIDAFRLPPWVAHLVASLDCGTPVEPFSFTVNLQVEAHLFPAR